jgi:spermidine/putrescine transport system ATP-binding protein
MEEVLRFEDVRKTYGGVVAVRDSSFTVERGTFVALLGPSGCGKTTTLRLIAGFEQPDSGRIHLDGHPVENVPPHLRPVNTVFQDFGLFPHMTVFDNVAFGPRLKRRPRRETERRVGEMLDLVRLAGMERRRPHQLSGGQQQRVALARALVNEPTILLLDEPLSNLDYKLRKEMRVELKRIQRKVNTTFVFVTHDREEALALADHIIVMNAGSIQQAGRPVQLYTAPANRFVADFLGAANFLPGRIVGRSGRGVEVAPEAAGGPLFAADAGLAVGTPVVLCFRAHDVRLSREQPNGAVNAMPGTIEETLYLGQHSEILVRLPSGDVVQSVSAHRDLVAGRLAPGEPVYVHWSPEESLLFERP